MIEITIWYYSAKLQRTERAVEEYRAQIDTNKPENYGFASMAAVPYAHIVANILRDKKIKSAYVTLAPNPKDIVSGHVAFVKLAYSKPMCRSGRI